MTDESLFAAALAIGSPADRAAFLDRGCAGNPNLRQELEELLAAHGASNPLDRSPADLARTGAYDAAPDVVGEAVGSVLAGRYKLIERIGEGGMGAVFMAQQTEPVKRLVAVKVIREGMDSRQVLARFKAERQALAMMDHPNIARVLDAGTTAAGRPFFVMELVKGVPVTQFCDDRTLSPQDRLALFIPVCQAIQHAHQKGVIHRDVKPGNVLVALYDGKPVPKVIDFGVAKAAGQPLTDRTLVTGFGTVVGTPEYMSPEQAELNQLDIDTRSDVFALGVLLYELLTGTTPLDRQTVGKAALLEVLRIVREEEPPKPSTRLSSSAALPAIAARRGTDPARLSRLVRGELDWIVMKALEKDRGRRYDTATALGKDVQRFLAGETVEACPPTLGYRLRKAYRRNR
ncbi:serine/threonine-protein kinase [Limnoglobus roseus]|uniref:Tetratricopeptide repeat protein n=1 Tax=Limnoglobus roseus TaxID=2598579 RepID=A0A5C1AU86_9BACT|nr:serine/threonine-protein kinase [Limnoglobus roseus]QEL20804.1 tetratricopeptide repeat protein [Limnoglobus roseus]